jgi:hypothetical protein
VKGRSTGVAARVDANVAEQSVAMCVRRSAEATVGRVPSDRAIA